METGIVFDIKGFALNDGPGIRTTVFLKGCPLRCVWCHNPEGLSPEPELTVKTARCVRCGRCFEPCSHPECQPFGRCLHICPRGCLEVAGKRMTPEELCTELLRDREAFGEDGGVTFSGGEPMMQSRFVCRTADLLRAEGVKTAVETSSFAAPEIYRETVSRMDYVMADIKLMDDAAHRRYCGVPNGTILENLRWLKECGKPFLFRVPLIPGITDTEENLCAISSFAGDAPVELLPYNPMAGAKYASVDRQYAFPDKEKQPPEELERMRGFFQNAKTRK